MPMRVLIVDDEPIARRRISRLLKLEDDVEVVNEVGSGTDAVAAIREQRPDLVFLDVQMPDLDGFGVVSALGEAESMPAIVFVTAYNEYAVKAANGATWEVKSDAVNFGQHVGHTVTVTGTVNNATAHGAKEKVKDKTMDNPNEHGHMTVTNLKMVSESCKQ